MKTVDPFYIVQLIVAVGLVIGGLEYLVLARFSRARPGGNGIFSTLVTDLRTARLIALSQVVLSALLLFVRDRALVFFICIGLMLTSVVLLWFFYYGAEASDYMNLTTLTCLVLVSASGGGVAAHIFATYALSLTVTLSYFIAGLSKAVSPFWGRGDALRRISRSATYGSHVLRMVCTRTRLPGVSEKLIIAGEIGFPTLFVLPPEGVLVVLSVSCAFHFAASAVMGLNLFVFSYVATYPAVLVAAGAWPFVANISSGRA